MTLVNPTKIIPLGGEVEISLNLIFNNNSEINIENKLTHPSGCLRRNTWKADCYKDYPERLKSYII